jgi:hypothetical protein
VAGCQERFALRFGYSCSEPLKICGEKADGGAMREAQLAADGRSDGDAVTGPGRDGRRPVFRDQVGVPLGAEELVDADEMDSVELSWFEILGVDGVGQRTSLGLQRAEAAEAARLVVNK